MSDLSGLRIVVTRALHQAEELAVPLRELGAEVLLMPVIEIAPPLDPAPLREAAAQCDEYDWIVFGSINAVNALVAELPLPHACRARVAAVGAATRDAAERYGLSVHVTPEKYTAEALAEALSPQQLSGKRVLIPSAAVTRDVIPPALTRLGAHVEVVEAYRTVLPSGAAARASEVFRPPLPDWVIFASPSAVENTLKLIGIAALQLMKLATIGPVTSQALFRNGLTAVVEADPHTVEGLVKSLGSK